MLRQQKLRGRVKESPFKPSTWLRPESEKTSDEEDLFTAVQELIVVEVDDLFEGGYARHRELIEILKKKFQFGKHLSLKQTEGGTFDGMRMTQTADDGFRLSMKDYILDRVREIRISPERKKQKEQQITAEEFSRLRAFTGSVLWCVRKCRPDAAGPISLLQRKGKDARVHDLIEANSIVQYLRDTADLGIHFRPIPIERVRICVFADSSLNTVSG